MIPRDKLSDADRAILDANAAEARFRRAALKELRSCINGSLPGSTHRSRVEHGPVLSGVRCERCRIVHAHGLAKAREMRPELFG